LLEGAESSGTRTISPVIGSPAAQEVGLSHRKIFRRIALSFAVAASSTTLSATIASQAHAAGTLIWGMPAETDTLDPHATGGWSTHQVT